MEKDRSGGVGGVSLNGHAARHTDPNLDNPRPPIGWLTGPAAKSNPQGSSAFTPIGPNTALWDQPGRPKPFTTGDQRGGKPSAERTLARSQKDLSR
jgi:hypothetical protein